MLSIIHTYSLPLSFHQAVYPSLYSLDSTEPTFTASGNSNLLAHHPFDVPAALKSRPLHFSFIIRTFFSYMKITVMEAFMNNLTITTAPAKYIEQRQETIATTATNYTGSETEGT